MRLAIILLGLIVVICVLGGIIPQGMRSEEYARLFGDTASKAILFLGLNRVFTVWWFVALVALLLINLFLCSLSRFPSVLKQFKEGFNLEKSLQRAKPAFAFSLLPGQAKALLPKLGFRKPQEQTVDGVTYLYQSRNRLGIWGSWLSHLGMLIIVVGFALGQVMHVDTSVYGVPGQTKPVEGHDLAVQIDNFDIIQIGRAHV